jgi:hypothetical protein
MSEPSPSPDPPEWSYCRQGADPETDPVACRGIHVPGSTKCLDHLEPADLASYFDGLRPGANVDHRGTALGIQLLRGLLDARFDPALNAPRLGEAHFDEATLEGETASKNMWRHRKEGHGHPVVEPVAPELAERTRPSRPYCGPACRS